MIVCIDIKNHIIRATLESMAYQVADVMHLMEGTSGLSVPALKVDGGASANNLLLSTQADVLGIPLDRPTCIETTALGAAYLAGLALGVYSSLDEIRENNGIERRFTPEQDDAWREERMARWHKAVQRSLAWVE